MLNPYQNGEGTLKTLRCRANDPIAYVGTRSALVVDRVGVAFVCFIEKGAP
jgi:hypothetical protein